MAPNEVAPVKRARLTLSQLASYDDILTDALIDHVYYWTSIRKNRAKYNLTRGFSEEQVTDILRDELIVERDAQSAERRLLQLPGIKRFVERLKTKKEQEDFKRHLRKYINIWSNDCPFEIATTNRYTIVSYEAAVMARKSIEKGETIKYLCGNLVAMSPEEEKDLGLTRRDFSIVMSSRKKTPSLFLGPARFANHDCRANARLVTTGSDGMQVVALRKIEANDEITVTYGEDYFGIDNCECLCRSCESSRRNGWAKYPGEETDIPAPFEEEDIYMAYSLRRSRKLSTSGTSTPKAATPDIDAHGYLKRRRSESVSSTRKKSKLHLQLTDANLDAETEPLPELIGAAPYVGTTEKNEKNVLDSVIGPSSSAAAELNRGTDASTESTSRQVGVEAATFLLPETQPRKLLHSPLADLVTDAKHHAKHLLVAPDTDSKPLRHPNPESAQISTEPSDVESVFDHGLHTKSTLSVGETSLHSGITESDHGKLDLAQQDRSQFSTDNLKDRKLVAEDSDAEVSIGGLKTTKVEPALDSDLSSLSSNEEPETEIQTSLEPLDPPKRSHKKKPVSVLDSSPRNASTALIIDPFDPRLQHRHPGDYIRTPILLAAPYSRWVDCRTCLAAWVQADGYITRRECPRCERHSKLYGYQWPKTERGQLSWVGGRPALLKKPSKKRARSDDDDEERILDHRTVHRFINANQERVEHRKGRGLEPPSAEILAALAANAENSDSESSDEPVTKRERTDRPSKKARLGSAKKGTIVQSAKASAKGKVVALLKKKTGSKDRTRAIAKVLSKIRSKKGKQSSVTSYKGPGRPPGSKSKVHKGNSKSSKGSKAHDIFDLPSDSEDDDEAARKKRGRSGKPKKTKKKKKKSALETAKVPGKGRWKGWVEVTDDESGGAEEDFTANIGTRSGTRIGSGWEGLSTIGAPKNKGKKIRPQPKVKSRWKGWIELQEGESLPMTVEEAMEHATSTGTRRGTQLGLQTFQAFSRSSATPSKRAKSHGKLIDYSGSLEEVDSAQEASAPENGSGIAAVAHLDSDISGKTDWEPIASQVGAETLAHSTELCDTDFAT